MLAKIASVVFYFGLALFFFHVTFPLLELFIGAAALILGILSIL